MDPQPDFVHDAVPHPVHEDFPAVGRQLLRVHRGHHQVPPGRTHFWWPDLGAGMCEIRRVLKPGGRLLVVAEFYNGQRYARYADRIRQYTKMAVLDVTEHRAMFMDAGVSDVQISEDARRGWIAVVGTKP